MKTLHYIQHVPFETPGCILDWAQEKGIIVTATHTYKNEPFPAFDDFDFLVIMGGPMGVQDTGLYPWLVAEKEFIARAIQMNKKVLGICLGAQLIAFACGAKVYANPEKEVGWHPVSLTQAAQNHALFSDFPAELEVFHWHGETFTLPANAIHLARSTACEHQAFLLDEHVLGFQFHLEVKAENVKSLLEHCPDDLSPSPFTQDAQSIQKNTHKSERINRLVESLLDKLFI